jgi:hypothetical protein
MNLQGKVFAYSDGLALLDAAIDEASAMGFSGLPYVSALITAKSQFVPIADKAHLVQVVSQYDIDRLESMLGEFINTASVQDLISNLPGRGFVYNPDVLPQETSIAVTPKSTSWLMWGLGIAAAIGLGYGWIYKGAKWR